MTTRNHKCPHVDNHQLWVMAEHPKHGPLILSRWCGKCGAFKRSGERWRNPNGNHRGHT